MDQSLKHVDFEVPGFGEFAAGPQVWPSYRDLVLSMAPIAYWRLAETSTTESVVDETGQSDGTFAVGTPTLGLASALQRSGDRAMGMRGDGFIHLPLGWGVYGAQNRSYVGWLRAQQVPDRFSPFFSYGTLNTGQLVMLTLDPTFVKGALRWAVYDGTASASTNLADGVWHQFAFVLDGSTTQDIQFYIDGQPDAPGSVQSQTIDTKDTGQTPCLGGRFDRDTDIFPGDLDEIAVWDRALTSDEVARLYQRGLARVQLGV
jgi:hypothetical protein